MIFKRILVWLPLGLFGAALIVFGADLFAPAERQVRSAMIGKPIPAFELPAAIEALPGLTDTDLRTGQPRLLNIFASWCVPCAVEAPQLEALNKQGAEIVAVAIRDKPEDIAAFLERHGNPFAKIGADDLSKIQFDLGSSGVPETFVVDGQGVIRYQHIGEIRPEHVSMLLTELEKAK